MESRTRVTSAFVCGMLLLAVLSILYVFSYPLYVRVRYATWTSYTNFAPAPFYRPIHWTMDHSAWALTGMRRGCACIGADKAFDRERHWYATESLESTGMDDPLLSEVVTDIQRRLQETE